MFLFLFYSIFTIINIIISGVVIIIINYIILCSCICCCVWSSYSTLLLLLSPYLLSLSQSLRTRNKMATPPHARGSCTASRKTSIRVSYSGTTGNSRDTMSGSRHSNSSSRSSTSSNRFSHSSIKMSFLGDNLNQQTSSSRCSNP